MFRLEKKKVRNEVNKKTISQVIGRNIVISVIFQKLNKNQAKVTQQPSKMKTATKNQAKGKQEPSKQRRNKKAKYEATRKQTTSTSQATAKPQPKNKLAKT